jgi:hypothetical protein
LSNRMLKKSASGVLASLRGSTYRSVRLASSLAAALLDGHFEHPAVLTSSEPFDKNSAVIHACTEFFRSLLTRIIHEHFCCNRRSAAATRLRAAGSPLGPSTYCTSTPQDLRAPRAALTTRLRDFATNSHESCGLIVSPREILSLRLASHPARYIVGCKELLNLCGGVPAV